MNTKQQLRAERNAEIFEEYRHLYNVEGKRPQVIYEQLGKKHTLTPLTVERIVTAESKKHDGDGKRRKAAT